MLNPNLKIEKSKLFGIAVLSGIFLLSASPALAICQGPIVPCGGCLDFDQITKECLAPQADCQFCHIFLLIANLLNFVLTCVVPIIGGLMFVVGGIMFMLSYFSGAEILPGGGKGGPQLFSQAKKAITAVIFGIVIIFLAWVFLNTFLTKIGVARWTGLIDDPETAETEGNWWEFTEKCPLQ